MTPEHRHRLYDLTLQLTNDGDFYRAYTKDRGAHAPRPVNRRARIKEKLEELYPAEWRGSLGSAKWDDVEHIRRYIDNYWSEHLIPAHKDVDSSSRDLIPFVELDPSVNHQGTRAQPTPAAPAAAQPIQSKEQPMTTPIQITTKTFANGVDIATLSDSAIYELIAKQEAQIKELSAIENKPKRLVEELEKRAAGIKALVAFLDSKAD